MRLSVFLLLIIKILTSYIFAEKYSYGNVVIGGGGFVSAIVSSPIEKDLFYARTDVGGVYRWDNGSNRWEQLLDWVNSDQRGLLGVDAIAVDPKIKGKLYLMAGTVYWNQADDGIGKSAFLKSSDYGKTWSIKYVWDNDTKLFNVHGNGMGRGNGEALAVDPNNPNILFFGTRNKGLWKSDDNGENWQKIKSFPIDTTWNGCGISFVVFDKSSTTLTYSSKIYVGVLKAGDNVYVSKDGGNTWSVVPNRPKPTYDGKKIMRLMPQRAVITPDGKSLYITFGNGAGPHTMAWDEGWGPIQDWFNRGAVYKYDIDSNIWTNVSPQNFINPSNEKWQNDSTYFGCYSGISMDPNNPNRIVVSSISSYRGTQYWQIDGQWKDCWGDNVFTTEDGGKTWAPAFKYVWVEGGQIPEKLMDENGYPWIVGNTIHWIGSVCMDPNNPKRVFVTSGNGVFETDNIFNYKWSYVNDWGSADTSVAQHTVWKFCSAGIEETVPSDLVSIPNGPVVSTIFDYEGFVHDNINKPSKYGKFTCDVGGTAVSFGSNTSLAYATKSGKLARTFNVREVKLQYNSVPIAPVAYSIDTGKKWSVETYTSHPPIDLKGGKVALSANGDITLWMPENGNVMYRYYNSSWSEVRGINFNSCPVADCENSDKFYVYNNITGFVYYSEDGGSSFVKGGEAGISDFKKIKTVFGYEGDVWVPIGRIDEYGNKIGGLKRSVDGGKTFTSIEGVGYCEAVGFGKSSPLGKGYPSIYIVADIGGDFSIYRSDDEGKNWLKIGDDEHEFGGLANGEFIVGDRNYFGLFYMSTAGRGIVYGTIADSTSITNNINSLKPFANCGYSIKVAPNPLSLNRIKNVNIYVESKESDNIIEIYDLYGKMVATSKLEDYKYGLLHKYMLPGVYKIVIVDKDRIIKALSIFTIIK